MENKDNVTTTAADPAAPTPETPKKLDLKGKLASFITDKNSEVAGKVIENLAKDILKNREDMLVKCYKLWEQMEKDLSKIKPDILEYGRDGKVSKEAYKPETIKRIEKLEKDMGKIDRAMEQAINKCNYAEVEKIAKNGKVADEDSQNDPNVSASVIKG